MLRRLGYRVSPLALAPVSALGNVAAVVTPGATGDIIRAPFLKGHHAVAYSDSFATIVYERTYSFCILCLSTLLVVAWNLAPHALRDRHPRRRLARAGGAGAGRNAAHVAERLGGQDAVDQAVAKAAVCTR